MITEINYNILSKYGNFGKMSVIESIKTFEEIKDFIGSRHDPNISDYNGDTLLHYHTDADKINIMEYLLDIGANPNAKNSNSTPLHIAKSGKK